MQIKLCGAHHGASGPGAVEIEIRNRSQDRESTGRHHPAGVALADEMIE